MILPVALAHAEEPVEPSFPSSPPTSIDDAETVEPGHGEINVTAGFAGGRVAWAAEAPLIDANLGITENIHVNAEIPWVFGAEEGEPSTGLGRGAVAVKLRVVHTRRVQLAFHPAVELPPVPQVSYEARGATAFTLPVVLDVGVGDRGAGIGLQLSRTFTTDGSEDAWGAAVGFATPLDDADTVMFDYAEDASPILALGEGWFEVGFTRERLFGSEHLVLLSSLGRSTAGNSSALLGVQVAL